MKKKTKLKQSIQDFDQGIEAFMDVITKKEKAKKTEEPVEEQLKKPAEKKKPDPKVENVVQEEPFTIENKPSLLEKFQKLSTIMHEQYKTKLKEQNDAEESKIVSKVVILSKKA